MNDTYSYSYYYYGREAYSSLTWNWPVEIPDDNPSFDIWLELLGSSSESAGEKAESMEASVSSRNMLEMSKGSKSNSNLFIKPFTWNLNYLIK